MTRNARRPADGRENDRASAGIAELLRGHVERKQLGVESEIAHAARDEQVVLRSKIEHRDHGAGLAFIHD